MAVERNASTDFKRNYRNGNRPLRRGGAERKNHYHERQHQGRKSLHHKLGGHLHGSRFVARYHTVQAEAEGFQVSVHNGVLVEVARNSTVDLTLVTGNVTQSVEVQESALSLNTTQPELGTTIENKVVQELPLEISGGRGRQIDSFVFLAPGVTGNTFSKRINGGVDFENEIVFNGVPMAQSETQGFSTIWNPPFEQVSEFNVLRSSFSAQYGLAQGVITYQTKSGTNEYHGDGFEIIRNNFFDARGAYNPTVPIDKENNYGFAIGGPVRIPHIYNGKNRTFFFFTHEWYRLNQTQTGFVSEPTAAEKQGNFNGLVNGSGQPIVIFDPTTGKPFPNNTIPQSRFSPLSASLLSAIPDPTLPGISNNYPNALGVLPQRQTPWGFNIDHNITDTQSIHWSEWRDKQTSFGQEGSADLPLGEPTFKLQLHTRPGHRVHLELREQYLAAPGDDGWHELAG